MKKNSVVNNDLLLSSDVGTRIDEFALPAVNSVVQVRKSVGDLRRREERGRGKGVGALPCECVC